MNFDRYTLPFIIRSGRRLKVARGIGRDAQDSQKAGQVTLKNVIFLQGR